jgi:hypothetical protein
MDGRYAGGEIGCFDRSVQITRRVVAFVIARGKVSLDLPDSVSREP